MSVKQIYNLSSVNKNTCLLIGFLCVLLFLVERISSQFDYFITVLQRPTYMVVMLMCLAGLCYILIIRQIVVKKIQFALFPLFLIGLLLRLLFLNSTPIYEDDFYRYFFDGSLVHHGLNPYQYSPEEALDRPAYIHNNLLGIEGENIPSHPDLQFLADQSLVKRVAYPHISTIYPPVTQSIFALSYTIKPFSLITWRYLLILFDVISFILLIKLLKYINKPIMWSAIYWLNPLLITETVNAAHMDVLLVPALLFSLLCAAKQRYSFAGLGLALAVGIKLWPLLLIPSLFKPLFFQPKKLFIAITPCLFVLILVLLPQVLNYTDTQSGLNNYTQYWRTNSFIFGLLEDGLIYIEQYSNYLYNPEALARYIVSGIIVIFVIFQFLFSLKAKPENKPETKNKHSIAEHISHNWLLIIVGLFFLSPTSYPWYFIWFLPLLAIKPNLPLLSLTVLLPLYDLRYPLSALNNSALFNNIIIPIQFLPPLIFILITTYKQRIDKKYR